jgi:hypothetical protein
MLRSHYRVSRDKVINISSDSRPKYNERPKNGEGDYHSSDVLKSEIRIERDFIEAQSEA